MESLLIKYLVTFLVGLIFGIEREIKAKPAGMRTHILVAVGALTFTLVAIDFFGAEAARIVANLIVGIGFIGAGTIMKYEEKVVGLTTAASLWLVTAIAMAIGTGQYNIAFLSTMFGIITLILKPLEKKLRHIES
ncbi:MAG: MgtC/SapB family protein [Candidatus Aenigmatarchaeota archaeon]